MPSAETAVKDSASAAASRRCGALTVLFQRIRYPLVVFGVLLGAWEVLGRLQLVNPFFLPPPSRLATTFWELLSVGFPEEILLQTHLVTTLSRIFAGYSCAVVLAIPLGLAIGYFPLLDVLSRNLVVFGRSVAPVSVLPLFIAWAGIGEVSKIAVVIFACFWATLTNTIAGVKFVDPYLIRAAQALEATPLRTFFTVVLPAALPRIFAGLKISLAIAFMVIVAAEMIATVRGLGTMILEARTWFRTDITMVGMITIGILGFMASLGLDMLERWLMPWSPGARSSR